MENQMPSNDELKANVQRAVEQAEAFMNVAQNRANSAEAELQRATKAAEIADVSKASAHKAKEDAEASAQAAEKFQDQAKGFAELAANEQKKAADATMVAEQSKVNSQTAALAAAEKKDSAEAAAVEAEQLKIQAKAHVDEVAVQLERVVTSANLAVTAKNSAVSHAENAGQQLEELNKTLENAITATLGGAFQNKSERSRRLDFLWLGVLIFGISGIFCIGYLRYGAIAELIHERAEISYIALQLLINLASMSGPIWLSWVATLRLAKTHAITEDYSYKAALAQAYQGYSTSVAEEDEFLKYRLFATVITQLDASPVRFVSEKHPATPFQDLLQQPWMEEILNDETFKGKFVNWLKSKFKTTFQAASEGKAE